MAKALTTRGIEAMKPDPTKRLEIPDGAQPGLYLVAHASGRKSWAVRYRWQGKPRKLTLEPPYPALSLAQARAAAQAALRTLAEGRDPADEKREAKAAAGDAEAADRDHFKTQAERYVAHLKRQGRRSWPEVERLFRLHVEPRWSDRRVQEIGKRDLLELAEAMIEDGKPIAANRVQANLRACFRWLVERDVLPANPAAGLKLPAPETTRDRVLSDEELAVVWHAAGDLGAPFDRFVRLLTLTAARRNEVAEAEWSEFDLEEAVWRIPGSRTKNKRAHSLPLPAVTVELVKGAPKIEKCPFVFSTTGKTPVSGFARMKQRLDTAILKAMQKRAEKAGGDPAKVEPLAPWGLHDLRRTAASGMARLGIAPHVIEAALNHASGAVSGLAAVYNRYGYDAERAAAFEAWTAHVARVTGTAPAGEVVPLRRRKRA